MNQRSEIPVERNAVWAQSVDVRASFIVKTYVHLFLAIGAFALIEFALFSSGYAEAISRRLLTLPGGWLAVLGGFLVVSWIATSVANRATSLPAQYAALAAFVAAEAIIFVPLLYIAAERYPGVIESAGLRDDGGIRRVDRDCLRHAQGLLVHAVRADVGRSVRGWSDCHERAGRVRTRSDLLGGDDLLRRRGDSV